MRWPYAVICSEARIVSCSLLALTAVSASAQITQNLEIIWQKSYVDGAAPDSLWSWGRSIASAGDVNGDGYDDIVVGTNTLIPGWWLGKAHIFFGGSPLDTQPDVILTGAPNGSSVINVSSVGDFNADGYDDVIVAHENPAGGLNGAKIFYGNLLMDTIPDLVLETRPGYSFAHAVAYAGDVNGDTYDDCITGDYSYNGNVGRATIFFGGPSADSLPDVVLDGHGQEGFGRSVGGGGDLNGDGLDDVIVGAHYNDEAGSNAGKVYIYFGGDTMDTVADVWMHGEDAGQYLGQFGVDILCDSFDYDWALTGTPLYPYGFPNYAPGKVYVLYGGDPMNGTPDASMIGRTDSSSLGMSSAGAGQLNSSRYEDVIAGAPEERQEGGVYVWISLVPFDTVPDGYAKGEHSGHQPGWRVTTAADVDGDGVDEVVFSNYASSDSVKTVWVAKYTGTGVEEKRYRRHATHDTRLRQNRPNPFRHLTTISYHLSVPVRVNLTVYDIAGRLARVLVNEKQEGGTGSTTWDGRDQAGRKVPSGMYFYRLTTEGSKSKTTETRKLVLVR